MCQPGQKASGELCSWNFKSEPRIKFIVINRRAGLFGNRKACQVPEGFYEQGSGYLTSIYNISIWGNVFQLLEPQTPKLFQVLHLQARVGANE